MTDLIEMAKKKRREEHPVHRSDQSSGNRDDSSGTQGLFEEDEDTPLLRANESFDSQNIPLSPPLRFDALPYEGSPRRIRRGMSLGGVSEVNELPLFYRNPCLFLWLSPYLPNYNT